MFAAYNKARRKGVFRLMMLYRLAKWMEERKRLKHLIAEANDHTMVYKQQKAHIERQMMHAAHKWLEDTGTKIVESGPQTVRRWEAAKAAIAAGEVARPIPFEDGQLVALTDGLATPAGAEAEQAITGLAGEWEWTALHDGEQSAQL